MKRLSITLALALTALILTVLLVTAMDTTSRAQRAPTQGPSFGTEYRTFWSGELRIFALTDMISVTIIDIATGLPLDLTGDSRIVDTFGTTTNPFVLTEIGDSFEGIGGLGDIADEIQVRIETPENKPVLVWTGSLEESLRHPSPPPDSPLTATNAWMSYVPALPPQIAGTYKSAELGREFLGFTSAEMYLFAGRRAGDPPTQIVIKDLLTNKDTDEDDDITLTSADASFVYTNDSTTDVEVFEVYFLNEFDDDTFTVTSNVDLSVLVGIGSLTADDWTATPPSYREGDDGFEKGKEFYALVPEHLTVYPLEDDTTVTVTDLSDGDDSITVNLNVSDSFFDFYTPVLASDPVPPPRPPTGDMLPRTPSADLPDTLAVNILTGAGLFDNDYVRVTADKDILAYVGPVASDINEYADMATTNSTGPQQYIVYAYAQNSGGSNDLQIFGFDDNTVVKITSLTRTEDWREPRWHDFVIGPGIGKTRTVTRLDEFRIIESLWLTGTAGADVWWGSDIWSGEVLRIEANKSIVVLNGDYDRTNFGAFVPFDFNRPPLPPVAVCRPAFQEVAVNTLVSFDGEASYDEDVLVGDFPFTWEWDFDEDGVTDATGPTASQMYTTPGVYRTKLTYTDDEGNSDTAICKVAVRGSVTIIKEATDDATAFDFTFENESFTLKNGESKTFADLPPDTYTATESVPDDWVLREISCDNGTTLTGPNLSQVTIDLEYENVVCIFNNEMAGSIKITKLVDEGDTSQTFSFSFDGGGFASSFELMHGESKIPFDRLPSGTYVVAEEVPDLWRLTDISCTAEMAEISDDMVTIDLQMGEDAECTFTNKEVKTAIDLSSFTAAAGADRVTLAWETASEIDNEGFNLYRSEAANGPYVKLNTTLIPALGSVDTGASYEYVDTNVVQNVTYYYKLEDVDVHGASTFHGPVWATPSEIRPFFLPIIFGGLVLSGTLLKKHKEN